MTNAQTYARFDVIWNGRAGDYLCTQPDRLPLAVESLQGTPRDDPRDIGQRARVLAAVSSSGWRIKAQIAELAGVEGDETAGELWWLRQQGKIRRQRTQQGVWAYQRV